MAAPRPRCARCGSTKVIVTFNGEPLCKPHAWQWAFGDPPAPAAANIEDLL